MPSSVVARIHYYVETATLRVVYVSGTIYDYLNVPQEVYEEMKAASSKGTFLNNRIKGVYDFRKVSD